MKQKSVYVCQNCGYQSAKWLGKCPECGNWNTFNEEIQEKKVSAAGGTSFKKTAVIQKLSEIKADAIERIDMRSIELNRVLGGGLVPGSVVLIGGEPGIGKSTLLLQTALKLDNKKILYISGEESAEQINLRAQRIEYQSENLYLLTETLVENIISQVKEHEPDMLIIDSVQTLQSEKLESAPGTVSQIRECSNALIELAKTRNIPILLVGHITKDGSIAGPKVLEHMVDTVLQFEGDQHYFYRVLRSLKNRFGSTAELALFEMQSNGLKVINNPSELLLSLNNESLSGISVATVVEGMRPLMLEVQALVSTAAYGTPQRSAIGFDQRRLNMLLAVLEKKLHIRMSQKDVFLNIAGGLKIDDPAADLAVICSLLSSELDLFIGKDICFAGEVGLSGEIRPVSKIVQRISEAEKLGFKQMYISGYNENKVIGDFKLKIHYVNKVEEVFKQIFKNT
jgi:DNA repair protein RadA/Sms